MKFAVGQTPQPTEANDPRRQKENKAPVAFWDAVERGWNGAAKSSPWAQRQAYRARLQLNTQAIEKATGRKAVYPQSYRDEADFPFMHQGEFMPDAEFDKWVATERQKDPKRWGGIRTSAELKAATGAAVAEAQARASDAFAEKPLTSFLGSAIGSFGDPDNALTSVVGGGPSKTIVGGILREAAINAGTEAVQTPERMRLAKAFNGPEYGLREAAFDIAAGGVGGAIFEGGGQLAEWGARTARLRLGSLLKTEPTSRGALRKLEMSDIDEAATGPTRDGMYYEAATDAVRTAKKNAPIPPQEAELGTIFGQELQNLPTPAQPLEIAPGKVISSTQVYQGRAIHSGVFDPMALKVDAETFQFKADGDASGVTARLKGIEKWDPTASGKVIVWENATGERFIADGHQRRGLAARLFEQGYEEAPRLDGYLFREADGWSPRDVRVVAALKNIREGSGTILDAAKVFREAPGSAADRSLPVTGDFVQSARGLASLSDEAFGAVVNKVVPERYAAEIGTWAGDRRDLHDAMIRLMKEADPTSIDEARALVKEALLDDMVTAEGIQTDLFGHAPPQLTTIARAKIKAAILSSLKRDAKVYAQLGRNADIIEAGGNVLRRSENEARLQLDLAAAEVVNRLSLRSGPIGEAFADAARAVTEGRRAGDVAKDLTKRIKTAIKNGEALEDLRAKTIDPQPPATAHLSGFDDPDGAAAKAQIEPKPEDAEIEAAMQGGLFDDMPDESVKFETARTRLAQCAPGGQ